MKLACVLGTALAVVATGSVSAGEIKERTRYFMVSGSTFGELDRAFGRSGPLLGGGERHGGSTEVTFDPHVTYRASAGGCDVDRASIRLNLNTTLPKWAPPRGATPETTILWRTMRDEIATHESRHAAIAKSWLVRIENRIKAMPRAADCRTMAFRVNAELRSMLARHDRAQVDFDRKESRLVDARLKRKLDKNMGQFVLR